MKLDELKRIAIQCGFVEKECYKDGEIGTFTLNLCTYEQLQAFANAIESQTIDRCALRALDYWGDDEIHDDLTALKDKE
jgi:hypothetical protein